MGKIVGLGGGGYDDGEMMNVAEHIVELSGKKAPRVLFLPTAGFDNTEGDEQIQHAFEKLGCSAYQILYLSNPNITEDTIKDVILGADIIYVGGGHFQHIMDTFNETNASVYLKQAFENGTVLSGVSSGSMCWFERGYDDCGEDHAFMFYDGLGLLPYCNCPHYESDYWQPFKEAVKSQNLSAIACDNGAALVYNDGKYYIMHGNDGGDAYFFDANDGYKEVKLEADCPQLNK